MGFPVFEYDKYKMREITIEDIDDLFAYYSDEDFMKYTATNPHKSIEETEAMVKKLISSFTDNKGIAWAIADTKRNRVIGNIGLYYKNEDKTIAGVGYNVSREYQNRGIATWALSNCIKYGLDNLNIKRIESTCKTINKASERVMQKCGMVLDEILENQSIKNGIYYDVCVYSITL